MMGVYGYKHKKDLKKAVGQRLNYVETSMFGPEYRSDGTFCVVGPDAERKRSWYAQVTMENGLIKKVS